MDCNKDEAVRAKEIAEKKLTEKDISGAKKFALKAHNLFPGLEGLSQFMATLDVYVFAEKMINGEIDWYGVLGVDPFADDETIKKQYRKLALILHPDKNKSVGSDGAFKLVSHAWGLLSDKAKRTGYDQKLNLRNIYQKAATENPSMPAGRNGFHTSTTRKNFTKRDHKTSSNSQPIPTVPRPSDSSTFWTACNRCHMQYEYLRRYLNSKLLCPGCHVPFLAVEIPAPHVSSRNSSAHRPSYAPTNNVHVHYQGPYSTPGGARRGPASASSTPQAGPASASSPAQAGPASASSAAQAARENLKRRREEAQRTNAAIKKRRTEEHKLNSNRKETVHKMGMGNVAGGRRAEKVGISGSSKPNSTQELSQAETRTMLMGKARMEIRKKLDEWSMAAASKAAEKEMREIEKGKLKASVKNMEKATVNGLIKDGDMDCVKIKNPSLQSEKNLRATATADSDEKAAEIMSMSVPDPDFHDFDKDRSEKSFGNNQVWAAYDNDDGMPRYYALIQSVLSKRPFKMRISWLNSKSNAELGPINWVGSGFSKTSGDFRISKYEVYNTLNSFSHRVNWSKGPRGVIQIFPRKGDVWALYSNWSPDWNELTPDEVIHKYEMVEVLHDDNKGLGVTIVPLVKVVGFKSVFRQHLDAREVRTIPREEMFRFSHQVPSYLLTGQEAQKAPEGCRELDPAALPLELLQVTTEAKEVKAARNDGKATKPDGLESVQKDKTGPPAMQNAIRSKGEVKFVYQRGHRRNRKVEC
ncbi:hypothetical protein RJ640_014066 [Escallonia rubra]|uniref:J domain-containing protein n=1 Tax=Escallonia rubra TaxID=112253 RepID=A0AA88R0F6_9ASTE|nr:hypothetical protein RJ640_014066 [Escallonia rubra]